MASGQIFWTEDDWAAHGYVLVTIRERCGLIDPVYIKRSFSSKVITKHEWGSIVSRAKRAHANNKIRKVREEIQRFEENKAAMRRYSDYAEHIRNEQRKRDVASGAVPFDERTFFDII